MTNDNPKFVITIDKRDFYVRKVAYTVQDNLTGELVYHCDEHVGGPFPTLARAWRCLVARRDGPPRPDLPVQSADGRTIRNAQGHAITRKRHGE